MTDRADYYVYVLFRENGEPFYVGKGYGRRWRWHETADGLRVKGYRTNIIRDMLARGVEVPKMSATRLGKKRPPFSPEWRAKLSAAAIARWSR